MKKKMERNTNTKTVMGAIFNLQNSYLLTFSLPTEEIFQIHGQNWPVAKLPVFGSRPQPREMPLPEPLNT